MSTNEPVIFFGMGPVALASLEYIGQHFDVKLVVTKPDRSASKNRSPQATVSQWARTRDIPVLEPSDKAELEALFLRQPARSRVGVVVDFGLLISERVIDSFPKGIVNSHFSLLPEWRGADPITFAILSGQSYTGVSIMLIVPDLDEGDLIAQERLAIAASMTTPQLTAGLVDLSNRLLVRVIPGYIQGTLTPYRQDPDQTPTYSRKIKKEDGAVDWHQPAEILERQIRAYLGWPGSYSELNGTRLIFTRAHVRAGAAPPGSVFQTADRQLAFGTARDLLVIERLKPEGKAEMDASAYLNGRREHLPLL